MSGVVQKQVLFNRILQGVENRLNILFGLSFTSLLFKPIDLLTHRPIDLLSVLTSPTVHLLSDAKFIGKLMFFIDLTEEFW
jgi:hypothetical protein